MSKLFSPIELGGLVLPNRIIVPPMCQYAAENGQALAWHSMHYGSLSFSGAGLLIIEATAVRPEGRISPFDLGLWSDACAQALAKVVADIRHHSATPIALQLAHAGRKASVSKPWEGDKTLSADKGGWQPVAPSPLPYKNEDKPPHALNEPEIEEIINAYASAAIRAAAIGIDALELHCAHGYLLHEFLSPISNQRGDHYGGSLANRLRLPLEAFKALRANFPASKPVGVRVSGSDWVDGGWQVEDNIAFAQELAKLGCAYVHVSGGGLSLAQKVPLGAGYQTDMAARIKAATSLPVIAVGLITASEQAEHIVVSGQADMVAVGRAMLYNPRWPWHAAAALGAQVSAPPQYWRSQPRSFKKLFG